MSRSPPQVLQAVRTSSTPKVAAQEGSMQRWKAISELMRPLINQTRGVCKGREWTPLWSGDCLPIEDHAEVILAAFAQLSIHIATLSRRHAMADQFRHAQLAVLHQREELQDVALEGMFHEWNWMGRHDPFMAA